MTRISGIDLALARKVLQTEAEAILALVNRLDDRFSASPVAVGRALYLRGERHLYCIGEK